MPANNEKDDGKDRNVGFVTMNVKGYFKLHPPAPLHETLAPQEM